MDKLVFILLLALPMGCGPSVTTELPPPYPTSAYATGNYVGDLVLVNNQCAAMDFVATATIEFEAKPTGTEDGITVDLYGHALEGIATQGQWEAYDTTSVASVEARAVTSTSANVVVTMPISTSQNPHGQPCFIQYAGPMARY